MRTSIASASAFATLAVAVAFSCMESPSPPLAPAPTAPAEGAKRLQRLPVAFVPNLGQWEHAARYLARVGTMTVFLEEKGWTFTLVDRTSAKESGARGVAVRMTFAAASEPTLVAEDPLPGRHHYFLGNDPSRWSSDVPLFASVLYREMHAGVDVRAREHDGHFEYDLLLQPHADLAPVEILVDGIERMHLDADTLVLETSLGPVRMPAPLSWEEGPSGERSLITCRYVLRGANRFGFEVSGRRLEWALVVDPGLVWSTYLGGASNDQVFALALDAQGAVTVAGDTHSSNFPTTAGAFDPTRNSILFPYRDVFVTRLSADGSSLVYSTFLGGSVSQGATALAVDAQGAATVAGVTHSGDFPTTPNAFDTTFNGVAPQYLADAFVTRLSPAGSSLVYSTFLGGSDDDWVTAVALDAQGAATVAGQTYSADFPTTPGAFDTSFNGATTAADAFVTQLAPTGGSILYSTFLGGTGPAIDSARSVAVDAQGIATVTGLTDSPDFPTTPGAFDTSHNGGLDAFVTRLSPSGSSLVYSTVLGGTRNEVGCALALDGQGGVTVAGGTASTDFPTTAGAFDTSLNGQYNVFITRLAPTGASLIYSTFLGGTGVDNAKALALDARGAATVTGYAGSADFPTTPGAFDTTYNSTTAFLARLSPTGSSLVYSTFFDGTSGSSASALALDAHGAATLAGFTGSANFPTTPGAFDTSFNGNSDGFVARLDMLPTGVAAFGRSSAGCTGALAISVTSMPRVGNLGFALTCGNAPPSTSGLLALTGGRFANPVGLLGIEIWVDPTLVFLQLPATSNNVGASEVPLPIPTGPWLRGTRLFAQFFWAGPASPPPCPPQGLSASNALEFTIQP